MILDRYLPTVVTLVLIGNPRWLPPQDFVLAKKSMQHAHLSSAVFFTPKNVGTFYMQGYKVKEKTAIVPHCTPSFKTQWAPCYVEMNKSIIF